MNENEFSFIRQNFINVVAPKAAVGSITLDGVTIPGSAFSDIGTSGFSGAQLDISLGSHNLSGSLPFGVFVYGFDTDDSYGYPGGQSLAPVATVTTVALAPKNASNQVNTQHCVTATVRDQNNNAVVGVRVDFQVTGANAASGFTNTSANGTAQFCYTGTKEGDDVIVASVGNLSDQASKTWTTTPKQNQTITFGPIPDTMLEDSPFTLTATASSGLPVTFTVVSGPATIAGNTVTLTGPGTVVIQASQAGNDVYNPAPDVDQSFEVKGVVTGPSVIRFVLIDADSDEIIQDLNEGDVIDLAALSSQNLTVRAYIEPEPVGSVTFNLSGAQSRIHTENTSPYSLFVNAGNDFFGGTFIPGSYTLVATPFSETDGAGTAGVSKTVNFTIINTAPAAITGFVLVNADIDADIQPLTDGAVLDLAALPTTNLSVRATADPDTVGSVVFDLNGGQNTENVVPYALFGDTNGDYYNGTLPVGTHTLKATPYSAANATGTAGTSLTVNFTVVNSEVNSRRVVSRGPEAANLTVSYAPNPFTQAFTLKLAGQGPGKVPVRVYDMRGRVVKALTEVQTEQTIMLGREYVPGVYILEVGTGSQAKRYRLVKAE